MDEIPNALGQLLELFGPLVLCMVWLQSVEAGLQGLITRHFGWRGNLWTGWLGAPIHEYSHALMAKLFGLHVVEIAPFLPDKKSGRLGYVVLLYDRGNLWQKIGHFFVCFAPLIGGAFALWLVSLIFYPGSAQLVGQPDGEGLGLLSFWRAVGRLSDIVNMEHLGEIKFWLFSYLVLSIGSHLAPSSSDYRSCRKSLGVVLLAILAGVTAFVMMGGLPPTVFALVYSLLLVVQTNLILACLLCGVALMMIYVIIQLKIWLS